ncbi:MAG: STAS domain-containing protein [Spartobacteria bacterium]|nr:STAS domain-containing protein [Spartobacteria bacterium]
MDPGRMICTEGGSMKINEQPASISFDMRAELKLVDQATDAVCTFLSCSYVQQLAEVKLVMRELLINAVEHGSKNKSNAKITCVVELFANNRVKVVVEDEGTGFDVRNVSMRLPLDADKIRNRGYPLIKACSEQLIFNERGNRITAFIKIQKETQFEIIHDGENATIRATGNITATTANYMREQLVKLLEEGVRNVCFDMEEVDDVDSVSLSVFIILHKTLTVMGGAFELEMKHVSSELIKLFTMTRMDRMYVISPRK